MWNDLLLCVEMVLFSLALMLAFPVRDFQGGLPSRRVLQNFKEVLTVRDIYQDVYHNFNPAYRDYALQRSQAEAVGGAGGVLAVGSAADGSILGGGGGDGGEDLGKDETKYCAGGSSGVDAHLGMGAVGIGGQHSYLSSGNLDSAALEMSERYRGRSGRLAFNALLRGSQPIRAHLRPSRSRSHSPGSDLDSVEQGCGIGVSSHGTHQTLAMENNHPAESTTGGIESTSQNRHGAARKSEGRGVELVSFPSHGSLVDSCSTALSHDSSLDNVKTKLMSETHNVLMEDSGGGGGGECGDEPSRFGDAYAVLGRLPLNLKPKTSISGTSTVSTQQRKEKEAVRSRLGIDPSPSTSSSSVQLKDSSQEKGRSMSLAGRIPPAPPAPQSPPVPQLPQNSSADAALTQLPGERGAAAQYTIGRISSKNSIQSKEASKVFKQSKTRVSNAVGVSSASANRLNIADYCASSEGEGDYESSETAPIFVQHQAQSRTEAGCGESSKMVPSNRQHESPYHCIDGSELTEGSSSANGDRDESGTGAKEAGAKEAGAKEAGAKEAGAKEAGAKEAGAKEAGAKEAGAKEAGAKEAGAKEAGAKVAGAKEVGKGVEASTGNASDVPAEDDALPEPACNGTADAAITATTAPANNTDDAVDDAAASSATTDCPAGSQNRDPDLAALAARTSTAGRIDAPSPRSKTESDDWGDFM